MTKALVVVCVWMCSAFVGSAQEASSLSFMVRTPSATMLVQAPDSDVEFDYLERTLADMDFFRANNYDVSLPAHPLFDGSMPASQAPAIRRATFAEDVYRSTEFDAALATLHGYRSPLGIALERITGWAVHDGFEALDTVTVTLTLYGPGGSFDPDTGGITLWTDQLGQFKGGGGLHTIIHEMIHIAVEYGIAQPLQLQHWERERLVDLLVQREFSDLVPDYRLQRGDTAPMDPFVVNTNLSALRESIADYVRTTRSE